MREQLFHACWSFHFNENAETIDAYINHIWQVATLLGYQEPQILEVFRNTLPTKLYWVLFPIMKLGQAVEMTKIILTKEKIDRQLAGQTSLTTFMSIKECFSKKVTFDMMDSIEQKTDKLTVMMGKLIMEDDGQNRHFNLKYISLIETEVRLDASIVREDPRTGIDQTMHIEDDQGMDKIIQVG